MILPRGVDGDDHITAEDGTSYLRGRNGADVFKFIADGDHDQIFDFDLGTDVIDVSAWGATQLSDLTLAESGSRLEITHGSEEIQPDGYDAADLSSFTASDFIFTYV